MIHQSTVVASLVIVCVLVAGVSGQEVITLRSGNGSPGGQDANITFVAGPFAAPFTATDYSNAAGGAPAEIIPNGSFGWASPLSTDPLALWISTAQSGAQPQGLFAVPFTVNSSVVGLATISINMLVDDFLGDGTNTGMHMNGIPIPNTATTAAGTWANEVGFTAVDITAVVSPGANYLYLYGNNTGGPGGLDFSATITVYASPEFQVNQAGASLDIDGLPSSPAAPMTATRCPGQPVTVNFASANTGLPYEVGITAPDPLISATTGAFVLPDGQVLNLNTTAPSISFINGFAFTTPFPAPSFSATVSVAAPVATSAQMAVVAPSQLSGYFLSAPCVLDTSASPTLLLSLPDDGNAQVILSAPPLCYTGGVSFYGTVYSDLYVNSNGDVSFTMGHGDFTATSSEWQSQMPRIGVQSDLEPNVFGTVDVTVAGPAVQVNYLNVTEWGTGGGGQSSWTVEFNGSLAVAAITGFVTSGTWGTTPCVGGASLGVGGTHPALVSFDALAGGGLQANANVTDSIIDENLAGMLINTTPWTDVLLPLGDGSTYIIN